MLGRWAGRNGQGSWLGTTCREKAGVSCARGGITSLGELEACVVDNLVDHGRDQHGEAGEPEPAHEQHDSRKRPVGRSVVGPVLSVGHEKLRPA